MPTDSKNPETIALYAGYRSDPTTNAVAAPIYRQRHISSIPQSMHPICSP